MLEAAVEEMRRLGDELDKGAPPCESPMPPPPAALPVLHCVDAREKPCVRHRYASAVLRFLLRIDVGLSLVFLLFLSVVGITICAITQNRVSATLLETWHDLHAAQLTATVGRYDQESDRVYRMAAAFMSLYSHSRFAMESEDTLATLCSLLRQYDLNLRYRGFTATSSSQLSATSCFHGDPAMESAATMTGFISYNHIVNGTYYVDSNTLKFRRPLVMAAPQPLAAQNITDTAQRYYLSLPINAAARRYYRGEIDHVDPRLMWVQRDNVPHLIYFHFPAGLAVRGLPRGTGFDINDAVQVRVDGSRLCAKNLTFPHSGYRLAIFARATLRDADAQIISNNWGQPSVNDSSSYTAIGVDNVTYLRVSAITDPLMREAVKHVNLAALQTDDYRASVDFHFRGAPATVTVWAYTTRRGLVLPLLMVNAAESFTGPYQRTMHICTAVLAAAIVALTVTFWRIINVLFTQPLLRVAHTMSRQLCLHHGRHATWHHPPLRPQRDRIGSRAWACVQLTEIVQLLRAYDTAAAQLRDVAAFIPDAVRQQQRLHSVTDPPASPLPRYPPPPPSHDLLHRHLSTVVHLIITPSATISQLQLNIAAILHSGCGLRDATHAASHVSTNHSTAPFPNQHALTAFVAAVQELCRTHHGTVHRLCPDACVLHFNSAVRAHLPATAAPAPAAAAVAPPPPTPAPATRHGVPAARSAPSPPPPPEEEAQQQQLRQQAADTQRHAARDARNAAAFALALASWVDAQGSSSGGTGGDGDAGRSSSASPAAAAAMPDVRALLDTSVFTCGQYRPAGSEQTLQVALGRDVQRELGRVPQRIGVRVAMTEETAVLLRGAADAEAELEPDVVADGGGRRRAAAVCDAGDAVRQLPVDVLRTGRAGLDECTVVLYEALPGRVAGDAAWQCYARCCVDGFAHMLRGDYAGALAAYRGVADIADLEPGLLPAGMRREAAASAVTGGAASVQVARLMEKCEYCVTVKVTESLCRATASELGVDEVLGRDTGNAVMEEPKAMVAQERRGRDPVGVVASHSRQRASSPACASRTRRRKRPRYPAVKERCVVVLRDGPSEFRCVVPLQPAWIEDNFGQRWSVTRYDGELSPAALWSSNLLALGSSGALATVNYVILRDVAPAVAKAIESAPAGPMSAAMRSTAPVCGPTAAQVEDVRRAMKALRELQHPNLLPLLGYSHSLEGGVVLLWEFSPGGTLRQVLHRYALVKAQTMLRFAFQIVSALAYMHECGGTYGVLQLGNVMVSADGVCRLTGYSADRAAVGRLYRLHRSCYLSPAMAAGAPPTPACDMFCFGLLFVEAATLKPAWRWASGGEAGQSSGTAEELADLMKSGGSAFGDAVVDGRVVAHRELVEAAVVAARYPPLIRDTVRACLSPDPAARPSAVVVRAVLKRVLSSAGVALEEDTSDSLEMRVESLE
ncbi:protein kinase [Novymonas esmeraldas]|uniref:Protein kinase n=1 Tax=Novymonas esmeraldas TaxID=1808958 RepID=A0AAW0EZB5_9TRYP